MNEQLLSEFAERLIAAEEALAFYLQAKANAQAATSMADSAEAAQRVHGSRIQEAKLRYEICHHRVLGFFEGVIASAGTR